jgi:hypothetical protein
MTEFLITGPAMGKTTAAINWARGGARRQIVTFNESEAGRVRNLLLHPEIGSPVYDPYKVVSLDMLARGDANRGAVKYDELCVDNLDMMLERLFRLPVSLITARAMRPGMNHYSTW